MRRDREARVFAENPEHQRRARGVGRHGQDIRPRGALPQSAECAASIPPTSWRSPSPARRRRRCASGSSAICGAPPSSRRSIAAAGASCAIGSADIQISTIDAFCLSMLREFPLEADLDPSFALADETEVPRLVDQSLDKSLRDLHRARQDASRTSRWCSRSWAVPDARGPGASARASPGRVGRARSLPRARPGRSGRRGRSASARSTRCGRVRADSRRPGRSSSTTGRSEQPRYQLLARDLGGSTTFRTADDAAVRGLIDRVARAFPHGGRQAAHRSSASIPTATTTIPAAAAGKRHRGAALPLAPRDRERRARLRARSQRDPRAGLRRMFAIALAQYRTRARRTIAAGLFRCAAARASIC